MQPLPAIAAQISALTQGRDYVLVAHGAKEDVKFLGNLDASIAAGACYILDTVKAAQYTLQLHYRYSLEKLPGALSIPWDRFRPHAAGNDAFFALECLLMIAARDMSNARTSGNQEEIGARSSTVTNTRIRLLVPHTYHS
ncbi:hypothetical protein Trco_006762 [Trichoderma cornu-damae]|uniref:Gfd2/YDR514C-like C-terminal domain-containing protein n=1 Tax=Trichoderma cornu-damae TaxID=654480 RepID=A0A9P8QL01_9HYPO|nr:hypothetical protein Trco_006762 [Trichoderma cornu-damae]